MEKGLATTAALSGSLSVTLRDALLALTAINQDQVLLNYGNIVVQRDYQNSKTVRLLSGGVAGCDLSHAIFVGRGMLTAAILGEDAVPPSREILHTIRELNEGNNSGIFVIAQSDADLFNFGLAVDRANSDCRTRVKLLQICDERSAKKERYSCGLFLLMKILGAAAEAGVFFDDIYRLYQEIIQDIITVPVNYFEQTSLKTITLSHDFDSKISNLFQRQSQIDLGLCPKTHSVVLVNTCKNLDRIFELNLLNLIIDRLRQLEVKIIRMYYGNFVTAPSGSVFLTILKVPNMKTIEYLDAPCNAPGWHQVGQFLPEIIPNNEIRGLLAHKGKQHIKLKGPKWGDFECKVLVKSVQFACDALISCERQLNIIDAERSRGNVGSRLTKMAENVSKRLNEKKLPINCPYAFLKKMGVIAESAIGGTMGSIYGVLFESAANFFGDLHENEVVAPSTWAAALSVGSEAIMKYCAPEQIDKTMCYPILRCERGIVKEMEKGQDFLQSFGLGVSLAEESAQNTRLPHCKYSDSGAHAVGIWMRAVFEGVKLMTPANICEGEKVM